MALVLYLLTVNAVSANVESPRGRLGIRIIPKPMIMATIPSIRSRLRFFDGFQLFAASVSSDTLLANYGTTGLPPCASCPESTSCSTRLVGEFMLT
jgi:hypothetical protein